jgi:hypothetical protein
VYRLRDSSGRSRGVRFVGGLLGHWAFWTRRAVDLVDRCRADRLSPRLLDLGAATTDANSAIFDQANGFRGCIPGIHEVLRRQGLLATRRCLDPRVTLSPGQGAEIGRVLRGYPFLTDDRFVEENLSRWLA